MHTNAYKCIQMYTNAYADRGRPTLKDVVRFRNRLVRDPAENNSNNSPLSHRES
jgi:hypothetical protein